LAKHLRSIEFAFQIRERLLAMAAGETLDADRACMLAGDECLPRILSPAAGGGALLPALVRQLVGLGSRRIRSVRKETLCCRY
jgi:hypothetical protein